MMIKAIVQGITLIITQLYESIIWLFTDDSKQYTFRKYILNICIKVLLKLFFKKTTRSFCYAIYNGYRYTPRIAILLHKLKITQYKLWVKE